MTLAGVPDPYLVAPLAGPLAATVMMPGSKSATNRALLVAALARGTSVLRGALAADDTEAMIEVLSGFGVAIEPEGSDADPSLVVVPPSRGSADEAGAPLTVNARQSGTTARFVAPFACLSGREVILDGSAQLRARPMGPGLDALAGLGARVHPLDRPGCLPVRLQGPITGDVVRLPGDVSSQFVSGLVMIGPMLPNGLRVELTTTLVSRPYLDLTIAVMAEFGGVVDVPDGATFRVRPGGYVGRDVRIEPDASAASYAFAAAAICGGRVRVPGLGRNTVQGDLAFVDVLERMGATVVHHADATEVVGTGRLRGVDVDLADFSDTAPTLAVVAAFAEGTTRVRGIGFIRAKETDRIGAVVTELRRLGVDAVEEPDGFLVRPRAEGPALLPGTVHTYDDHRMAMSFAIGGLGTPGIAIADPGCVAKTFPGFWTVLESLRGQLT
jgi:3-phosphoshikimate 1-carboxyvinyltransferase